MSKNSFSSVIQEKNSGGGDGDDDDDDDNKKENLCLYGLPNEQWEVNLPADEVPPELPEPALGINFARDGMQEKDWLSLVAVHSDAWLLAVAFYFGARFGFDKSDRLLLEDGMSYQQLASPVGNHLSISETSIPFGLQKDIRDAYCMLICNLKRLFGMINDLPTIFEIVTGAAKKQTKEKSSTTNHSSNKSKTNSKVLKLIR
ncbi:PHD finger protein ALFIN-LIKE 4 [Asimina triloba]